MHKRLFLIGPDRSGKSDMIRRALGNHMSRAGGFRTRREPDGENGPGSFWLTAADGSGQREQFLEFVDGKAVTHLDVFSQMGTRLLRQAENRSFAVLDELGGVELLDDGFLRALLELLRGDTPCIGVMKDEGPGSKIMGMMGLNLRGQIARRALYEHLHRDKDTLVLRTSGRDDDEVMAILEQWVAEYVT